VTTLELPHVSSPLQQTVASRRPRLLDVDRGKGLAIILVVIGHIAARERAAGNDWYVLAQFLINSFHMPFFMYLAGYTFFYSGNAREPAPDYVTFVWHRAQRLLIPFLAVGLSIVLGKLIARSFLHVDNLSGGAETAFRDLLWNTGSSPAESIWFLFVLFTYCATVPLILRLAGGTLFPLLILAILTYFMSEWMLMVPAYLYLDRIATYLIFFILGGLAIERKWFCAMTNEVFFLALIAFAVALGMLAFGLFRHEAFVLCNFLGIPALHGLVRRASGNFLLWFGKYAFVVYLLNSIFIGLGKAMLLKLTSWDGHHFLIFFVVLGLIGLFGPILFKRYIFVRIPLLDRFTA
jgi:fucose 4-O-acetylase-like acetyltransferase